MSADARRSNTSSLVALASGTSSKCSTRSRIQLHFSRDVMCMYSHPMRPQYVADSLARRARSVMLPAAPNSGLRKPFSDTTPVMSNVRSRSASLKPYAV